jgi:hypothetical protein
MIGRVNVNGIKVLVSEGCTPQLVECAILNRLD